MAQYNRISLNDLIDRCTDRLGQNSTFWTNAEKRNAINEAIRVWAVMTGQWSKRFPVNTVAGQRFYDVPKQLVSLQRVRFNTSIVWPSSLPDMDYGFTNWQQSSNGTPQVWAPIGLDKFVINPPAAAGHVLYLEGVALAPAILAGGDDIDIGDEEVNRILDYAHHVLSFKEGGLEFEATQPLLGGFVEACVQRNQRLLGASVFKRFMGMDRAQEQRPVRSPEQTLGARG